MIVFRILLNRKFFLVLKTARQFLTFVLRKIPSLVLSNLRYPLSRVRHLSIYAYLPRHTLNNIHFPLEVIPISSCFCAVILAGLTTFLLLLSEP